MSRGSTLKAALIDSQGRLQLADLDTPKIGGREILVKMRACGVCGTDLEKLHGMRVTPPVLGHEVAGDVEEVGSAVEGYSVGDRVAVHHHVPCRTCFYCTNGDETMCADFPKSNLDPGGFAEYFRVPEVNVARGAVFRLPPSMSYREATFAEPTGCCIRGLNRLGVQPSDDVLVVGAGPVGLTHIRLLRTRGANLIFATDMIDSRLGWAKRFGADEVFKAARQDSVGSILDATEGRGVDRAIVASGSVKAIRSALRLVRKGGKILLFGIPPQGSLLDCDASDIFIREITLIPSYSTTEYEMKVALDMMANGKIQLSEMITHEFRLADIADAFRTAEDAQSSLKVIVRD